MLKIKPHKDFKKDLQRDKISGFYADDDFANLKFIIDKLAKIEILDEKYKDYQLKGAMKNFRECHIKLDTKEDYLYLARLGSHNQLFRK